MSKVACIGECMIELKQADGGLFSRGYGGDTLNTAVYLARLGAGADYITALGDDTLSDEMIAGWAAEGVGTKRVVRLPGKLPGLYMIQTDDKGERRFFHWRESAAARSLMDLPRDAGDPGFAGGLRRRLSLGDHALALWRGGTGAVVRGNQARARERGAFCFRYQFPRPWLARSGRCARRFPGGLRRRRYRAGLDRGSAAALSRAKATKACWRGFRAPRWC